jgi:hypothetical protein
MAITQRPSMIWLVLGLSFLLARSAKGFSASPPFLARNCVQQQKTTRLAAEPAANDPGTPTAPAPTLMLCPSSWICAVEKSGVYATNSTLKRGLEIATGIRHVAGFD